jgi:hypothetical protein
MSEFIRSAMSKSIEEAQLKMQQKLGRCMLRLQQYERLLKAMVASMAVEGSLEELSAARARQEAGARDKSLGTLVRTFTGIHLASAPSEGERAPGDTNSGGQSADVAWASMRFNISMSPERYAQTKEGLAELVALRNDLVHHLIERFDISEESGCRAASRYLDSCYEQIDGHCQLMKTWVAGLAESQALASSFLQSKAFEDAFVHGINPDATVCWPRSTIVESLRLAETACQVDGWTSLDAAIGFISKENRDQTPSRYGCKTWRQVLKQSGQFELRSVAGSDSAPGHTWYRSCAKATRLVESSA